MKTPFTLLAALAFVVIVAAAVVTGSLIAASPVLAATAPGAPLDPQTLSWGLAAAAVLSGLLGPTFTTRPSAPLTLAVAPAPLSRTFRLSRRRLDWPLGHWLRCLRGEDRRAFRWRAAKPSKDTAENGRLSGRSRYRGRRWRRRGCRFFLHHRRGLLRRDASDGRDGTRWCRLPG